MNVGVFPIRDMYYEPQFDNRNPAQPFSQDRHLPGIDWNVEGQLEFAGALDRAAELDDTPLKQPAELEFYYDNGSFEYGDADYWYQVIRHFKPKSIIEIGSGNSTLMARKAIQKNESEDDGYRCKHVCIEPYQKPWLEQTGVTVLREKVEDVGLEFFSELSENDILFIDSTHMIRPQGDVLFEFLELLPTISPGVVVHVHDIFSPKNYTNQHLVDKVLFWNEQYLLEAFLSQNPDWKILGALNFLHHHHPDVMKKIAPRIQPTNEPGSFYMQRV